MTRRQDGGSQECGKVPPVMPHVDSLGDQNLHDTSKDGHTLREMTLDWGLALSNGGRRHQRFHTISSLRVMVLAIITRSPTDEHWGINLPGEARSR